MNIDEDFDNAMFVSESRGVAKMRRPMAVFHCDLPKDKFILLFQRMCEVCPSLESRKIPVNQSPYIPVDEVYFLEQDFVGIDA